MPPAPVSEHWKLNSIISAYLFSIHNLNYILTITLSKELEIECSALTVSLRQNNSLKITITVI